MVSKFLQENKYSSLLLAGIRLFLGWKWFHAGWSKLASGGFDASGFLRGAVKKVSGEHPAVQPWWGEALEAVVLPNVEVFNVLIPWAEFLVGIGLIFGLFTSAAAFFGVVMNFAYMFSGSAGINPLMALLGIFLITAGWNAGKIGFDRWVIEYFRKRTGKSRSLTA
ncbi:MAG TPA: DoxX family protein [Bacillales bacterium]|nr:DoxX family protein [Bacillales bacterium]